MTWEGIVLHSVGYGTPGFVLWEILIFGLLGEAIGHILMIFNKAWFKEIANFSAKCLALGAMVGVLWECIKAVGRIFSIGF